uniref:Uncharacterized protein n=1 Tax=Arundo donax TaxID=35708 RepID=A0A0A9GWB2_ARUDO
MVYPSCLRHSLQLQCIVIEPSCISVLAMHN